MHIDMSNIYWRWLSKHINQCLNLYFYTWVMLYTTVSNTVTLSQQPVNYRGCPPKPVIDIMSNQSCRRGRWHPTNQDTQSGQPIRPSRLLQVKRCWGPILIRDSCLTADNMHDYWTVCLFQLTISILLLIPGDISTLIDCFSFASWLVYGVTSLSLIVLRFTEKDLHRPYKVGNQSLSSPRILRFRDSQNIRRKCNLSQNCRKTRNLPFFLSINALISIFKAFLPSNTQNMNPSPKQNLK